MLSEPQAQGTWRKLNPVTLQSNFSKPVSDTEKNLYNSQRKKKHYIQRNKEMDDNTFLFRNNAKEKTMRHRL